MPHSRKQRIANAVGFLSGVLACMDALRDGGVYWPPSAVWAASSGAHRMELGGGIALILVTLVVAVWRPSS
jgi:hypothetical protein